jgi:hypothetical protein
VGEPAKAYREGGEEEAKRRMNAKFDEINPPQDQPEPE